MDTALRLDNDWIISAEQLWEMGNPRAVGFVCPDCRVKLIPAACDKGGDWKVRPYFKRPVGVQHADWCNMEARDKLVAEAAKTAVLTRNPPRLPVYTRLDLAQENVRLRAPGDPAAAEWALRHAEDTGHEPSVPFDGRHDRTARTIRPICRPLADFPHPNDRGARLNLPGVAAATYAEAFVPIQRAMRGGDPGRRIFFGEMRFRETVAWSDEAVTVTFNTGRWQGPDTRLARVRIDTTGWERPGVDALLRELRSVQAEASGKWGLMKQNGEVRGRQESEKGCVFFLGERDPRDPSLFHTSDRRLVCGFLTRLGENRSQRRWPRPPARPFQGAAPERSAPSASARFSPEPHAAEAGFSPRPSAPVARSASTAGQSVTPPTAAEASHERPTPSPATPASAAATRATETRSPSGGFVSRALRWLFGR